jgi:hypothetical protein
MPEDIWKTFEDNKIIRVTLCDKIREFIDIMILLISYNWLFSHKKNILSANEGFCRRFLHFFVQSTPLPGKTFREICWQNVYFCRQKQYSHFNVFATALVMKDEM